MGAARAQAEELAADGMTMGFPDSSGRSQSRQSMPVAAVRIEMPGGDPHQCGSNDELLDLDQAHAAINPKEATV